MKTWSKVIPLFLGIWGLVLATASGLSAAPQDTGAIQAIQQATDPSAAVAAFANGFAIDRNNPKLYDAYVTRMVDLGLPELAYHQAEALTTLDANNGLGWGVVGYVNARRGDMPAAISAIVLAGQAAPDNQFVQRTAGEIIAWYDLKADKTQIAENAKSGLDALRTKFSSSDAFTQAYDTAKKAYASQTNAQQAPAQQTAPSQPAYQTPPYSDIQPYSAGPVYPDYYYGAPGPYYSSYYYDWGPGWLAPSPFWWWYPCGFFTGFSFFPFSSVVVFNAHHHHHDFDHSHHDHDGIHVHKAQDFHHNDQAVWHGRANGQAKFFGTPTQPNAARISRSTTLAAGTTANSAFAIPATRANSLNAVRTRSTTLGTVDPAMPRAVAPRTTTASPRGVSSALAAPSAQAASRATAPTPATPQRGVASGLAAPSARPAPKAAPATTARPASAALAQPRTAPTLAAPTLRTPTMNAAPRLSVPSPAPTMARPTPAPSVAAPSHQSFGGMGRASAGGGGAMHGGGMHAGGGGGGHGGGGGGHR